MAPKNDIDHVSESDQTGSGSTDPKVELEAQKEQARRRILRGEGDPIERHQPISTDNPDIAILSRFRAAHAVVILAAVAMGLIAGAVLARLGGVLAGGLRPVLIPLFAEIVFVGIAFSLIHTLSRRR